jgi:uroporphyrinogen III methyltransferase/synthase
LPRAAEARDLIPNQITKLGAQIDVIEAYRNVVPQNAAARVLEVLSAKRKPDWITFTSSSTVRNLLELTTPEALEGIHVASIGPVTSATARELNLTVHVEAKQFDMIGLIDAILDYQRNSLASERRS